MILKNGQMLGPSTCDSYVCDRNPRTAVGATSGCITPGTGVCRIILLTVDGRQPGYSLG